MCFVFHRGDIVKKMSKVGSPKKRYNGWGIVRIIGLSIERGFKSSTHYGKEGEHWLKMGQVHSLKIYLFKDNDKNARNRCGMCSKLTIKTPERRQ